MREGGELMPRNGIWPVPIQGSFLYATERLDGVKSFGNVSIRSHDIGIKQLCLYVKGLLIHTWEAPHSSQWLAKI